MTKMYASIVIIAVLDGSNNKMKDAKLNRA